MIIPEASIWSIHAGGFEAKHHDGMPSSPNVCRAGEQSDDAADDESQSLEDPDAMDIDPAVVWLGTTNGVPTDTNGEAAPPRLGCPVPT
jgi:hypothetical protein